MQAKETKLSTLLITAVCAMTIPALMLGAFLFTNAEIVENRAFIVGVVLGVGVFAAIVTK
jgi:hypothetical protein